MKERVATSMVAAVALSVWPGAAMAYRVVGNEGVAAKGWASDTVALEFVGEPPGSLSLNATFADLTIGAHLWNQIATCRVPQLMIFRGFGPAGASGDQRNTVEWVYSDWASTGAASDAAGLTSVSLEPLDGGGYRIVEADIFLNAERYSWEVMGNATAGQMSVAAVVAHEFGHVLGLEHTCEMNPPAGVPDCMAGDHTASLMYPYSTAAVPVLFEDDSSGICSLYTTECSTPQDCQLPTSAPPTLAAEGEACVSSVDCMAPMQCLRNSCEFATASLGDACESVGECAEGVCAAKACQADCADDIDCPIVGQSCDADVHYCGPDLAKNGASCTAAEECISGLCLVDPNASGYCTRECSDDAPCAGGEACELQSGMAVCRRNVAQTSGCMLQPRNDHGGAMQSAILILMLGVGMRRFNKRSRSLVEES